MKGRTGEDMKTQFLSVTDADTAPDIVYRTIKDGLDENETQARGRRNGATTPMKPGEPLPGRCAT